MREDFDISYEIVSVDKDNDSLVVRPLSPLFKNAPSSYPCININISNLHSTHESVDVQIARLCAPVVKKTILAESGRLDEVIEYLTANQNSVTTLPLSATHTSSIAVPVASEGSYSLPQPEVPSDVNFVA